MPENGNHAEYAFNYSSILTCQDGCVTEMRILATPMIMVRVMGIVKCIVREFWICDAEGNTGWFYLDGLRKLGFKCFATKPFGS